MESHNPVLSTTKLTPQFCFTTAALQDFLRLSRSTIDDTIQQRLNTLATPSKHPFDPSAVSTTYFPRSEDLDSETCTSFRDKVLFSSWKARDQILEYCQTVANSPDPDDPTLSVRAAEQEKEKEKIVDERLDPYSGRFFPTQLRTEKLAGILKTEATVERIVRLRSWDVYRSKCRDAEFSGERAYGNWSRQNK